MNLERSAGATRTDDAILILGSSPVWMSLYASDLLTPRVFATSRGFSNGSIITGIKRQPPLKKTFMISFFLAITISCRSVLEFRIKKI